MESGLKKERGYLEGTIEVKDLPGMVEEVLAVVRARPSRGAHVVTLQGPLGAGKTTTVQAFARALGIQETVTSPTFVIQKRYAVSDTDFSSFVHIDAYRIEDIGELAPLGFSELLKEERTLVMIEWPERIASALPSGCYQIVLEHVSHDTRRIEGGYTT